MAAAEIPRVGPTQEKRTFHSLWLNESAASGWRLVSEINRAGDTVFLVLERDTQHEEVGRPEARGTRGSSTTDDVGPSCLHIGLPQAEELERLIREKKAETEVAERRRAQDQRAAEADLQGKIDLLSDFASRAQKLRVEPETVIADNGDWAKGS